jgi:error-prone DNA polymerase
MPGRSVLQWDKDDCAAAGLVKFDLLGLGMLTALHNMVDLVRDFHHVEIELARLEQEPEVYDLLCRADTVGVFQVESRAQMNTLPRVQPRCFYDLAIEVALIRPGPIQGHAVHPYIRRRNGTEPVTYLHPLLRPALERTLGVPLFQEQLMQIAIDVAGFTTTEADELRQAMSAKRSSERMARLRDRLFAGMAARQVSAEVSEQVYAALAAFANFGFPESHSVAFAHLVYSTAWCKVHYPAAFTAGLLNAQPMGFWSPQSLVADAKRHGVVVRRPDVNAGRAGAVLEEVGRAGPAVRLGLTSVRGIGEETARGRAWRTWCGGPVSPGPSWRPWPRPGPSTAWARPPADGPWCGERARPPRPLRIGSPVSSPDRIRLRSPAPPRGRRWPTTCGHSAWRRTPPPWSWPGVG